MAKPKRFSIGPIEEQGPTMTLAREAAIAGAAAALQRMDKPPVFVPAVPSSRSEVLGIMVFPTVGGYGYALALADGGQTGWTTGSQGYLETIHSAIRHLADLPLDGSTAALADVLQWHTDLAAEATSPIRAAIECDPNFDADIRRKHTFAAAYFAYRQQGLSDTDAHACACRVMG